MKCFVLLVLQLSLQVTELEARLCTPASGSRGDFLFSLGMLDYCQFSKLPEDLHPLNLPLDGGKHSSRSRLENMLSVFSIESPEGHRHSRSPQAFNSGDDAEYHLGLESNSNRDEKYKKTSADVASEHRHFFAHISEPFLHSVLVDDFKFVITLESRNALLALAESYYKLVTEAIPHLVQMPKENDESTDTSMGALDLHVEDESKRMRGLPDPLTIDGPLVGQRAASGIGLYGRNKLPTLSDVAMRNLFSLELNRTQIQLLDHDVKGCVVLTLDYACMQGRVGTDEVRNAKKVVSRNLSSEEEKRNMVLQVLVQRALDTYAESIMLSVHSMMVLVAPTDIDVGVGLIWLPDKAFLADMDETAEGITSSSNFGLLRPVLYPLPVELDILAIHEESPHHVIRMEMPEIHCGFDMEEFHLLRRVAERIAAPLPSLEERYNQRQTNRLRDQLHIVSSSRPTDLQLAFKDMQLAMWEVRRLKHVLKAIRQPSAEEAPNGLKRRSTSTIEESYNDMTHFSQSKFAVGQVLNFQSAVESWVQDVEDQLVRMENEHEGLLTHFKFLRTERTEEK